MFSLLSTRTKTKAAYPKRKRKWWLIITILICCVIVLAIGLNITTIVDNVAKEEVIRQHLSAELTNNKPTIDPNLVTAIKCNSTKGPFTMVLNRAEAPMGARVLVHMVLSNWFDTSSEGVAFFRVNDVATQFGVKERKYRKLMTWDQLGVDGDQWTLDPSPLPKAQRHSWPRGVVYMIGGTQMVIVLKTSHHGQGKNENEAIVARISEEDMTRVFDRLYAYNDIIDHPKGGPGPDQTEIYRHGWTYLNSQFPLVDSIQGCVVIV